MSAIWDASGQLVVGRVKSVWTGFSDFVLRDNVLEVAVGLAFGAAFSTVVKSLVSDVLLPIVSLLPFFNRSLEEKFVVLKRGLHYNETIGGYNTLQQAADDGAVALAYGLFITHTIHFLTVAAALYFIAQLYSAVSHDSIITETVKCRYCRKLISRKAQRCAFCCSWQDGREDTEFTAVRSPT